MKTLPSLVFVAAAAAAIAFTAGAATFGASLISAGILALAFREYTKPARLVIPLYTAPVENPAPSRYRLAA